MRSATFRNIALGILALAASYHLGARSATAQSPGSPIAGITSVQTGGGWMVPLVVLSNGDLYTTSSAAYQGGPFVYAGNILTAGPTPARAETWGAMKSRYRGERGAAQPAPQDR